VWEKITVSIRQWSDKTAFSTQRSALSLRLAGSAVERRKTERRNSLACYPNVAGFVILRLTAEC
jgi:hypothetical protein